MRFPFLRRALALAALALLALALLGPSAPAQAQNLVTNGGFETGNLAGWTVVASADNRVGSIQPRSGSFHYFALFGSGPDANIIEQTLATTPGRSYTVTFYLSSGSAPSQFRALWDGVEFFNETDSDRHLYEEHTFTLTATDSSTTLRFSSWSERSGWILDDVSVVEVAPPPDDTPPTITASANKTALWPPNGKMVTVTVTGQITDSGSGVDPDSVAFTVVDEYGQVQPSGSVPGGQVTIDDEGNYSFAVLLRASRLGTDEDGRTYTIIVTATDSAGNTSTYEVQVVVPHDQGN